jgi:hypothetical protein
VERVKDSLLYWSFVLLFLFFPLVFGFLYLLQSSIFITIAGSFIAMSIVFIVVMKGNSSNDGGIIFSEKELNMAVSDLDLSAPWKDLTIKYFKAPWEDISASILKSKFKILNYTVIKISKLSNKEEIEISLFIDNEKSFIELTKKYAPKDHSLYAIVKDYADKRGLKF